MQMVSDVPIGAFLSGGIDSSAVVAFMARHSDRPVKTYCHRLWRRRRRGVLQRAALRAPGRAAVRHGPSRDPRASPTSSSCCRKLLWHMDEPIADTAFITTYLVSEFARRDVTVILSGVGGDELFGGYRRYLGEPLPGYFERLPHGLREAADRARRNAAERSPLAAAQRDARSRRAFCRPRGCRSRSATVPTSRSSPTRRRATSCCANAAMRRFDRLAAAFARADGRRRRSTGCSRVDAETQLPDDLLLLTDKMSMAVSLECRVPLLDHELVELAARMPEGVKMRGGAAEARDEGGAAGRAAARHPRAEETRLRHADGRLAQRRARAAARAICCPRRRCVSAGCSGHATVARLIAAHEANRIDGTDRSAGAAQFRDLGAHLSRPAACAGGRRGRAARSSRHEGFSTSATAFHIRRSAAGRSGRST